MGLLDQASAAEGSGTDLHKQTRNKLEVVFLSHLCSPEPEVVRASARCLELLCDEARVLLEVTNAESAVHHLQANLSVYTDISQTSILVTGSSHKAQEKRIFSLLRCIDIQTGGNLAAWDGLFTKFCSYMDPYLKAAEQTPVCKHQQRTTLNLSVVFRHLLLTGVAQQDFCVLSVAYASCPISRRRDWSRTRASVSIHPLCSSNLTF